MEHDRRDVCLGMDGLVAAPSRSCVCPVSNNRFSSCHGLGPTSIMQGPTGSWAISCVFIKALRGVLDCLPGPVLEHRCALMRGRRRAGELSQRGLRRGALALVCWAWFNWQLEVLRPWFWGNIGEFAAAHRHGERQDLSDGGMTEEQPQQAY